MNEDQVLVEVLTAFGQGSATLAALILWLQSKFKEARLAWVADFEKTLDLKIAALEARIRSEISAHGDDILDIRNELHEIRQDIEHVHKHAKIKRRRRS